VIVVAGGSGVLGARLVSDLTARGYSVRALVRNRARAREILDEAAEIVEFDVRQRVGLVDALDGATAVISAFHGLLGGRGAGPQEVDVVGNANLGAAAEAVGAKVVLLSVIGACADSPAELSRAKYRAEQALRSRGGSWSIVRSAPFTETWVRVLRDSARASGRPLVLGRGEQPVPFVSVADVSAVVLRAATDPAERSRVLEVGGEATSLWELAESVQAADGRTAAPRRLPRPALRLTATLARPFSPSAARLARMALLMDTGRLGLDDAKQNLTR